jgi:hypothetical protein
VTEFVIAGPLRAANEDVTAWYEIIARWNAYACTVDKGLGLNDFLRYVLLVRAELDQGAAW